MLLPGFFQLNKSHNWDLTAFMCIRRRATIASIGIISGQMLL
jgi:hypothetical protein